MLLAFRKLAGMLLLAKSGREDVFSPVLLTREGRMQKRSPASSDALLDFFYLVHHAPESGAASYG
jgi:hypothetical protein